MECKDYDYHKDRPDLNCSFFDATEASPHINGTQSKPFYFSLSAFKFIPPTFFIYV